MSVLLRRSLPQFGGSTKLRSAHIVATSRPTLRYLTDPSHLSTAKCTPSPSNPLRTFHSLRPGPNSPSITAALSAANHDNSLAALLTPPPPPVARRQLLHTTPWRLEQASSKVEETVKAIQERGKAAEQLQQPAAGAAGSLATASSQAAGTDVAKTVAKKSIGARVWEEVLHYYHGFRLLFIDINVARKLLWKTLRGNALTRREYMLLIRTTGDVFRLVPFSVFIIVPFMELLLPVFIKFFPGMLPSTFETEKTKEDKARQNLKVKLEMAKFLQKTLDEMDVSNRNHSSDEAREFTEFFQKLRTSGERATPDEIMRFSKLFEDEITLDSLSRPQLAALCQVLEVGTYGTSAVMRFQLRMKLRSLAADDRMIQKEGVEALSLSELQVASRARGMRSYGLSMHQLRHQISEWINLSLNEKVPPSLLLLSRAVMLPENVPTTEKLKASMTVLSDAAATQTKAAIEEREGKIDNRTKIEIIRDEQRKIKEELEEQKQVESEQKVEEARVLAEGVAAAAAKVAEAQVATELATPVCDYILKETKPEAQASLSAKDIEAVSDAIGKIGADKKTLLVEKEEIKDLKEEIAEYKEDVEELNMLSKTVDKPTIKESNASKNLLKKVDSMISKLDKVLAELETKEAQIKAAQEQEATAKPSSELVRIDEVMLAIRKMQKVPDEAKLVQIQKILGRIDDDKDGQLKVDDVLRIIQEIGKESVELNEKQVDELMQLMEKEEHIENEQKIEKALAKEKEEAAAKQRAEELSDAGTKVVGGDERRAQAEELSDAGTKVLNAEDTTTGQKDDRVPSKVNRAIKALHLLDEKMALIEERLKQSAQKTSSSSSSSTPGAPPTPPKVERGGPKSSGKML